ncbi:hypothetical protein E2562_008316 [Oryza meyeriana var. granulata]|uniref:RNase H type-1 domain-containing protein n=1 Tax=Oryza meyeriana var. granulata TaxID=110450 RepID=A0A6G1DIB4_9ORYZ|nr:hypothetical protein E2562_008316 [Oryza meyeriana var. granulata]
MGTPRLIIRTDSHVVAGQIGKSFQARHPELAKYLSAFRKAEGHFKGISVLSIPCFEIADADALAKAAANNESLPTHVLYEVLRGSAAQDDVDPNAAPAPVMTITTTLDWRGPIIDVLGTDERSVSVDLIDEAKGQAAQNLDSYIATTKAWFNTKLVPRSFAPGDMVLRCALNPRKLQNKWEGPFVVTQASARGAYRLADLDGTSLPHPWNAEALKKYYV